MQPKEQFALLRQNVFMATLLFLLTFLSVLVLFITLIAKALRNKPIKRTLKAIAFIIGAYSFLWFIFYVKSNYLVVPLGTDVCFDDWCATVVKIDKSNDVQKKIMSVSPDSTYIVLHVVMSNHARGIAQKPSEPRIHLIANKGRYWNYSVNGEQQLEKVTGKQISLGQKLELHQSLQTELVYIIPLRTKGVKVLIEEGPFISKLLLPEDQLVFPVP
jgi:hypothetical protein